MSPLDGLLLLTLPRLPPFPWPAAEVQPPFVSHSLPMSLLCSLLNLYFCALPLLPLLPILYPHYFSRWSCNLFIYIIYMYGYTHKDMKGKGEGDTDIDGMLEWNREWDKDMKGVLEWK